MTTPPSGTGDAPQTTVYEYDVAGRAWKVTHPDGGIVNTTYTPRGEVATTYGARSYPVEHTYDSQGRMKTLKTWQNKNAGTGAAVTTWTYDIYRGWLTAKKYEGRTTSVEYEYTPGGRLKLRRWERNASTGGRLVTTYRHGIPAESALGLPADGGLHRIEYGATTVGTPEVRYTYDRAGRRISTRQFNGATELRRVDWQPDETGAFGTETMVESGATTFTLTRGADSVLRPGTLTLQRTATNVLAMTYGYDTASRLTSVSDGTLSATYAYQSNSDLLSTITLRNGATTRLTTTRVYDRWGRLQSQWAVANAASVQPTVGSGYTYNAAGQRIRQDLGDGTYWTYAYDSLGQLTGAQRRWPDGTLVAGQQYGYLYDDIGNRKQSQEGGDANGAGLQTTTYTANLLNQYSSITTPGVASVNGLANATNTVTVNGAATVRQGEYWWRETSVANASAPVWASLNVAASNGGTTNTTVNRYVPKASETPTYDDDGNQTGDGRWIYRWDAENRLVEMETTSTAITAGVPYAKVRWTYDPLGRRIQRESWQGANPSVVTKYVYDGWQCLAELDGSNAVTATYAWGLDLSGSRTGAGGVGGLLWVNHTQHGRHFYSYDGNGNVCGLTSATDGTRTGGYEYDPFGGIIRANEVHGVAGWNEWKFSTKRQDVSAGLMLYEYRVYSVSSGRWMGRDPIQEAGGVNLTRFSRNRALCLFDALGLEEQGAPDFRSICEMAAKLRVEIDKLPSSSIKRLFFETQHCILAKLCHGNCCLKLSDAYWLTKTVRDFMDPAFEALAGKGNPRWRDTFLDVERWHLQAETSVGVLEDTGGAGETAGVAAAYLFNDWLTKMFAARHMVLTHVDQDLRQALKKNGIGTDSEWQCIGRQVSECEKVSFNKVERSISWIGGAILSPSFDISKFRDGMRNDLKPPQIVLYGYGQGGAW